MSSIIEKQYKDKNYSFLWAIANKNIDPKTGLTIIKKDNEDEEYMKALLKSVKSRNNYEFIR